MTFHLATADGQYESIRSHENQQSARTIARDAINDSALEALRAIPRVLEEALANAGDEFYVRLAHVLDQGGEKFDSAFASSVREVRDNYVNELVEARVDDLPWLTTNGAINQLRALYA